MRYAVVIVLILVVLSLTACGGNNESSTSSQSGPSAETGESLFKQKLMGTQPGCITCHSLEKGVILVGPSLAGIGSRAGSVVDGQSAEEYLRHSILKPDEHVVDGFIAGTMPEQIGNEISEDDLSHVIAYMLTLK